MHEFDETIHRLRSEGYKITPQRLSVIRYLIGNTSHPTAADIFGDLKQKHPNLSFSTVYNTLNMLEEIEEIQSLNLFDEFLNYDPDTSSHFHLVCRKCNRVVDIFNSGQGDIEFTKEDLNGHRIESVQVVLKGICKDCL